jgi:hypothetical protein
MAGWHACAFFSPSAFSAAEWNRIVEIKPDLVIGWLEQTIRFPARLLPAALAP